MSRQLNALKHGLYTKNPLLPFENKRQYQRHIRSVYRHLQPEDALQEQAAQEIAEFMWRMKRHQELVITLEKNIMAGYTPLMVAEVCRVPKNLHFAAPDWLTDLPFQVSRSYLAHAQKVCQQYEDARTHFASIPNLVKIIDKYPELFWEADEYLRAREQKTIIHIVSKSLEPMWQQDPKGLWDILFQVYAELYYVAHAKEIERVIRPELEAWFYIKSSEDRRLQRDKEMAVRLSIELRKKIHYYAQLKKHDWCISQELQNFSGIRPEELPLQRRDCTVRVTGVVARLGIGSVVAGVH